NGYDPVDSPAVPEFLQIAARVRKLVNKVPCEAIPNVEIGIAPIELDRRGTVIGLRGIRNEVLTVAGVVNRMRPAVVHRRRKAVRAINPQASLQRVVAGVCRASLVVNVKERGEW